MLVEQGEHPSLFDQKLISSVNGESKAGYVFTIYAKLESHNWLDEAHTLERREKYLLLDERGNNDERVTLTINKVNDIGYYQTTKLQYPTTTAIETVSCPISKAMYDHMAVVAISGIAFERCKIEIPNTGKSWEIDIFKGADGQRHQWVKIDLETDDLNKEVPQLPVPVLEYILDFPGIVTPEQTTFIERLYKHQWMSLDPDWVKGRINYKELIGKSNLD